MTPRPRTALSIACIAAAVACGHTEKSEARPKHSDAPQECLELENQLTSKYSLKQLASSHASFAGRNSGSPSVIIDGRRDGAFGGELKLLRKIGASWGSGYQAEGGDAQGDPRWPIYLLGTKAASFFGFRMLDPERMTAPNAAELNGAIAYFNVAMASSPSETIPLSFADHSGITEYRSYADDLLDRMQLPLASNGAAFVHDTSYHTATITLPGSWLTGLRDFTAFELGFIEHLRSWQESPGNRVSDDAIELIENCHLSSWNSRVDGMAAYGPSVASNEITGASAQLKFSLYLGMLFSLRPSASSPAEYLSSSVEKIGAGANGSLAFLCPALKDKNDAYIKSRLPFAKEIQDLHAAGYFDAAMRAYAQDIGTSIPIDPDEAMISGFVDWDTSKEPLGARTCVSYLKRRLAIIEAVEPLVDALGPDFRSS